MKLTTIQISEKTKKRLQKRKDHPRETYEDVIEKLMGYGEGPSMETMFLLSDLLKQDRKYTTDEILAISHELRGKR